MNIHHFVPNLFWPEAMSPEIYRDLSLPAIETLLARINWEQKDVCSLRDNTNKQNLNFSRWGKNLAYVAYKNQISALTLL